jgi:nitrogen regulatory protein PII
MQILIRCVMGAENLPAFVEGMTNLTAGMTVQETREYSPQTHHVVSYRGIPYNIGSLSVIVDIVIDESWVEDIVRRIREGYTKNQFTVRHLYMFPVEASYHIRNGFMDV